MKEFSDNVSAVDKTVVAANHVFASLRKFCVILKIRSESILMFNVKLRSKIE